MYTVSISQHNRLSFANCVCLKANVYDYMNSITLAWVSYQIRKIAGCACAGNAGSVFPITAVKGNRGLTIPACITARAWPHVPWSMSGSQWREKRSRHSRRMRTRNFTYLARGPCSSKQQAAWMDKPNKDPFWTTTLLENIFIRAHV